MRTETLAAARDNLDELADAVESGTTRVVLVRPGHDDVVLLSLRELRSLEETAALAADEEAQAEIAEGRRDYAAGNYVTADELRAEYGLPPASGPS